jgi:hypothetical protein
MTLPATGAIGRTRSKKVALDLVQELGLEAIDAGGSKIAVLIEPCAMLRIHLALSQGTGGSRGLGGALVVRPILLGLSVHYRVT